MDVDPLDTLVAAVRAEPDASTRATAAHRLLGRLTAAVAEVSFVRHEAVAELRRSGFSHAEVARLLGVHRNRAQHIAEG